MALLVVPPLAGNPAAAMTVEEVLTEKGAMHLHRRTCQVKADGAYAQME